jgi:thiamine biosynthesis lipoprotein
MRAAARCAAALAFGCAAPAAETAPPVPLVQIALGRPAMGTILEITVVAGDAARGRATIDRAFAEAERLEAIFTTWREDGELARLNARAGGGPQPASPELIAILGDAQRFARETGGAFDVTVGPLLALWRDAERAQALPSAGAIADARARVGAARMHLDAARATIALEAGSSVDLGGLAKGWALDRLGELLRDDGIAASLLDFGGSSLRARGRPLDAPAWRVALEDGEILALGDADVSISSGFDQTLEIGGERLSHIVDPATGRPVAHAVRAIVFAPSGAIAEAWSTALVVRGAAGLAALPCDAGIRARVIAADGEQTRCESAPAP